MKIFSNALPKWLQVFIVVMFISVFISLLTWPWPFKTNVNWNVTTIPAAKSNNNGIVAAKFIDLGAYWIVIRVTNKYYVVQVTEYFHLKHSERDSVRYEQH